MLKKLDTISSDIQRVSDLTNRPNYPLTYGGDGLSADALKARFDALPLAVRDKVNGLIEALRTHSAQESGASYIGITPKSYNEGRVTADSVADLIAALEDTGIAQLLMVHNGERICSLQDCLQEHTEQLKQREGILWSVQTGSLMLSFPDGQMVELPFASKRQTIRSSALMIEDHARYLVRGSETLELRYPSVDAISGTVWSDSLGRYQSEILTFEDAHTARGHSMFGACPEEGTLCVVSINDVEVLPPTVAVHDDEGCVYLHLADMDLIISPALEGVAVEAHLHTDAHQPGEIMSIYVMNYLPFESELRVCSDENGANVRFPESLYVGEVPDFAPWSIWDIHLDGGVIKAHKVLTQTDAVAGGSAGIAKAMEVIANAAY